jgi:hypothetical protein
VYSPVVVVIGVLFMSPVEFAGAGETFPICCEAVVECVLDLETLREIGSFGGLRLLPPIAVLSTGSSTPGTKGLTERSSLCEKPEKMEEFEVPACLSSGLGDPPNGLISAGSGVGLTGATWLGPRLSGR